MNYKNISKHRLIIEGIFDKYKISLHDNNDDQQENYTNEDLRNSLENFEKLMAVFNCNDEDKLKNNCIIGLGIKSIEDYNRALDYELSNFYSYSQYFPIMHIENMFKSMLFMQKMSDYLEFSQDDILQDPDDPDCIQTPLEYGLYTIYTCAKRSYELCRQIVQNGILTKIEKFISCFNKNCRIIVYGIFAEICKKGNFGQVSFKKFIIKLANEYLTIKSYDHNEEETSQISQLFFAFNTLEVIYDDDFYEHKFRRTVSEKALIILNNDLYNCFNSALKGLNDLVNNFSWFINEYDDLIDFVYRILERESGTRRTGYIITLLISLYRRLPTNYDDDPEVYEKFIGKFHEATQKNINTIINLINERKKCSIELYIAIISLYPDFLDYFADDDFLGSLYDCYSDSNFEIKNLILAFLAHSLKYQDIDFNESLFNNLIGKDYINSLISIDPSLFNFKLILEGLLCALNLNSEIVLPIMYDIDDIEDIIDIVPSDPEEEQLLKEICEICFSEN